MGRSKGGVREGTEGRLGCEARDDDESDSWGSSEREGDGHWVNRPIDSYLFNFLREKRGIFC